MDRLKKKIAEYSFYNDNIISIATIGSYNTKHWKIDISDIDIIVLLDKKIDVTIEFDIEDELIPKLQEYFNYKDIHLTFIYMNEFHEELARAYIMSDDKLILDANKEIDFRLYVNKYIRNNKWIAKGRDLDGTIL